MRAEGKVASGDWVSLGGFVDIPTSTRVSCRDAWQDSSPDAVMIGGGPLPFPSPPKALATRSPPSMADSLTHSRCLLIVSGPSPSPGPPTTTHPYVPCADATPRQEAVAPGSADRITCVSAGCIAWAMTGTLAFRFRERQLKYPCWLVDRRLPSPVGYQVHQLTAPPHQLLPTSLPLLRSRLPILSPTQLL
jgi:hypothetical protein